jgi:hypothetical protein
MALTYNEWLQQYPEAAQALTQVTTECKQHDAAGEDESWAQQNARFVIARAGGMSWRNNVGATPAKVDYKCGKCGFHGEIPQRVVRYGLCNDSAQLNAQFKSSDLIGVVPRLITPQMVGSTIGQFLAVEVKKPNWTYKGKGREVQQQAFLSLVAGKGAIAQFSTGEVWL